MAIIELSMVVGAIVEMGVEAVWDKAKRRETVIKVLRKAGLKTDAPTSDFDGIYAYTLVEYGIWKPRPVLDFFRHEFIRNAFRQSFEARDPAILQTEAESLIEWHQVGEELRRLDIDPRREFARFTAVFNEIVDRTRTPAEVRRDQKLDDIYGDLHLKADDILQRLDKLTELEDIRQELSRLTESYQARQFVMVPTGDKLKVFISSTMGELRDVREIVTQALQARGIDAWVYEARGGSRPDDVVRASLSEVEAADIYVGLFWQEYGEVTAKEYQHARALRKPCFVYVRDKDLSRDAALEEFLRTDVYDLHIGVGYSYFSSASKLGSQVGDDIMAWLVRQHREMSAAIQAAQVSTAEIERLRAEVDRLQAVSRNPLPNGTPADYLASQMRAWFETLGYRFESYSQHDESYFEWIIDVPARRGHDRILVLGVEGEADLGDVQALRHTVDAQRCDEGWLVAPRRVSQLARHEVCDNADRNLFCYTFDELLDEKANFAGYLNWLEGEIKRRGIDSGYIPLACTKEELDPQTGANIGESHYNQQNGWIDGYVDRWLDDPSKEHVSVLGEFGTGKTWFALHYAWVSLVRYREAKERGTERPRLPLVIPLRDYAKSVSVESLFSEFFFRKHEIHLPGYSAFEQLNRMGKLLLIFDGFDEMAAKIDRQQMINNFWELSRVVTPGAKVILTCRTEHFPTAQEGRALLGAELQASTAKLTGEPPQFEVLELAKFDKDQIRLALLQRTTRAVTERVMENEQLLDLASRPLMVELILEALPDIEAGKPIDLARVYLYAVRQKMERDIRAERTFTSLADKLYFLCEVSWEMLSTERMSLNYRHFPERLKRIFGPAVEQQADLDHWHYDMMSQTMLVRNVDGDYTPAHRSLIEFFVAYKLAAQLGALAPDFLEVARSQSGIDWNLPSQGYAWTEYFTRGYDVSGSIKLAAPLGRFHPEPVEDLQGPLYQPWQVGYTVAQLMTEMLEQDFWKALPRFENSTPEAVVMRHVHQALIDVLEIPSDTELADLSGAALRAMAERIGTRVKAVLMLTFGNGTAAWLSSFPDQLDSFFVSPRGPVLPKATPAKTTQIVSSAVKAGPDKVVAEHGKLTALFVPIVWGNFTYGILFFFSPEQHKFSKTTERYTEACARLLGAWLQFMGGFRDVWEMTPPGRCFGLVPSLVAARVHPLSEPDVQPLVDDLVRVADAVRAFGEFNLASGRKRSRQAKARN
jgi:predicted NACHT family NTPase